MASSSQIDLKPARIARDIGPAIVAILLIAALLLLVLVGAEVVVRKGSSPEDILREYINRVNAGEVKESVNLTVYALMDDQTFSSHVAALESMLSELGGCICTVDSAKEVTHEALSRHALFTVGVVRQQLEGQLGVELPRELSCICGVNAVLTFQSGERGTDSLETTIPFLKVGHKWYMVSMPSPVSGSLSQ